MVNNLPAMQETQVPSLGQQDPLEKEITTHSSFPAWKIPWREEPGGLQPVGLQKSRTQLRAEHTHHLKFSLGVSCEVYSWASDLLSLLLWLPPFLLTGRLPMGSLRIATIHSAAGLLGSSCL